MNTFNCTHLKLLKIITHTQKQQLKLQFQKPLECFTWNLLSECAVLQPTKVLWIAFVSMVWQAQKINKPLPLQFTVIQYRHYVCFCSLDAFKSLQVCDVNVAVGDNGTQRLVLVGFYANTSFENIIGDFFQECTFSPNCIYYLPLCV